MKTIEEQLVEQKEKAKKLRADNKLLKQQVSTLQEEVERLGKMAHRGGGRHPRFTEEEINLILLKHSRGATMRSLAKEFQCSIGLIHKIINEQKIIKDGK